jgi:hypothetical protein
MTGKSFHGPLGRAALGGLAAAALVAAVGWSTPAAADDQSGTTLSADKTATGFNEEQIEYDWTVTKSVDPTEVTFTQTGDAGKQTVTYTIDVTRSQVSDTTVTGVRGQVCVTNGGSVTTENLKIVDQVFSQGGGPPQPISGATQTITPSTQLDPGQTQCYDYEIAFAPVAGATSYKNTANVTITNHSGSLGTPVGPSPSATFNLPTTPTTVEKDASADVAEEETCPDGFTCTPVDTGDGTGPWNFTASDLDSDGKASVSFDKDITWDDSAECGSTAELPNTVKLTESDTEEEHTSDAKVTITTAECQQGGCTRTIGYWKTAPHAAALEAQLPITLYPGYDVTTVAQAQTILGIPNPSSADDKLKAQLLAALLDIKAGADGSAVTSTIADAQAYLAGNLTLTKSQVLALATVLDNYNNGLIGPGHCGDDS